ncbi:MAG: hypothetical protein ACLFNT_01400 [Spirochaetales bacterium]
MVSPATQTSISRNVHLSNILRAQYASGKVALPLRSGVYASFQHVKGVRSLGEGGYSLSKLQMMDLMIDRIVRLRGEAERPIVAPNSSSGDATEIDAIGQALSSAIHSLDTPAGSFSAGVLEPGLLFNHVA